MEGICFIRFPKMRRHSENAQCMVRACIRHSSTRNHVRRKTCRHVFVPCTFLSEQHVLQLYYNMKMCAQFGVFLYGVSQSSQNIDLGKRL